MKKYLSIANVFKFIAVLSDLITIGYFLSALTGWSINSLWANPHSRLVLCSLLFTVTVFKVGPALARANGKKGWVSVLVYGLVLIVGCVIIYNLPTGNSTTIKSSLKDDSVRSVAKRDTPMIDFKRVTVYDTTKEFIPDSLFVDKVPHPAAKRRISNNKAKAGSKFDLRGSTFQGPTQVGDNNTQNIGIQPRTVTPEVLRQLEAALPKTDSIAIRLINSDAESEHFGNEVISALEQNGFKVWKLPLREFSGRMSSASFDIVKDVYPNWYLVRIFVNKPVQQ